jgi:hypothetical protein
MDPESALRCWDRAAPAYSASRSSGPLALSSLYERVVEELLGEVRGKRVLDAGCGNGLSFAKTSSDSLKRIGDRPQIRAAESCWR